MRLGPRWHVVPVAGWESGPGGGSLSAEPLAIIAVSAAGPRLISLGAARVYPPASKSPPPPEAEGSEAIIDLVFAVAASPRGTRIRCRTLTLTPGHPPRIEGRISVDLSASGDVIAVKSASPVRPQGEPPR